MNLRTQSLRERLRQHVRSTNDLLPTLRTAAQLTSIILRHRVSETVDRDFFSTTAIKSHSVETTRIKWLERKRKLLHVLECQIVILRNARGALLCEESVRKRLAQRVHAPAGSCSRFKNSDVVTSLRQFVSSNKPGHSGAQNEHLFGRAG